MVRSFIFAFIAAIAILAISADAKVSSDKVFKLQHLTRRDLDFLAPWKVEAIRKLQTRLLSFRKLLAIADENRECLAERDAQIVKAVEALEAARRCRYNGLPWNVFSALRPVCLLRKKQAMTVNKIRAECNKLRAGSGRYRCRTMRLTPASNYLTEIQSVCIRVGLLNGPKTCPAIPPLRDAVNKLREKDCGIGFYTRQEIIDIIEAIIERIKELLEGNPLPSNDPRFLDVPIDSI